MKTIIKIAAFIAYLCVCCIFLFNAENYMQIFFDGLTVWAYNVLPVILPFAILTTFAASLLPTSKFSLTKLLFNVSCDRQYFTSLLCGYPIGAKCIAGSKCDSKTALAMFAFCSSANPIFIVTTVGIKLLHNTKSIIILILAHFLSTILNGLTYKPKNATFVFEQNDKIGFSETVTSSVLSVLCVGALIALFYMLTALIKNLLPISFRNSVPVAFILGLLEMTGGMIAICKLGNTALSTILCSSLLAFGGLCVILQCYTFVDKKIKMRDIIKMKVTQCLYATAISYTLCKIIL